MERFFRSLKNEWVPVTGYTSFSEAAHTIEKTLKPWPVLVDCYSHANCPFPDLKKWGSTISLNKL
jgi:hypothetical protein